MFNGKVAVGRTLASMADDEAGNSFQHLLAPIRDLVANWNVDIAADLGYYLDALEGITFAIDG